MFNSPILDFSISLIFLFLLFSLLTSWIMQAISSKFNYRGKFLKKMLHSLLGGNERINWTSRLYSHPMIETLAEKYNRITSYIPDETFADVMSDLLVEEGRDYTIRQDPETKKYVYKESKGDFKNDLRIGLTNMPESDLKRTLQLFYEQSDKDDPNSFKEALKNWYKGYMVKVNTAYGRKLKKPLIILGICIALAFNIDFFHISKRLWVDSNLRDNIVLAAENFSDSTASIDDLELKKEFFEDYRNSLDLPIGWGEEVKKADLKQKEYYNKNLIERACIVINYYSDQGSTWWLVIVKLMGFIMSGFIVSFGAPFWFDLLKKALSFKKSVTSKS